MKLYWGPHTCAIGIHILLEECGATYVTHKMDVGGGELQKPEFLAINPKGKVPTLERDDGSVLTEFGAIATWLARCHPHARLLPSDPEGEARMTEIMEYVEGTVHGQGFGRLFKPARFEPQDLIHEKTGLGRKTVENQGREIVEKGFANLDMQLKGKRYAAGEQFSIADAALFYVERWAPAQEIKMPPNMQQHFELMLSRASVQKVRHFWGET